jgi:hypothetical protein
MDRPLLPGLRWPSVGTKSFEGEKRKRKPFSNCKNNNIEIKAKENSHKH